LVPRFPRLKEWAYAGLIFDLVGAFYSHLSVGDGLGNWLFSIIGLVLVIGSYFFYQRKLNHHHQIGELGGNLFRPARHAQPTAGINDDESGIDRGGSPSRVNNDHKSHTSHRRRRGSVRGRARGVHIKRGPVNPARFVFARVQRSFLKGVFECR